jgi:hypothetical protein
MAVIMPEEKKFDRDPTEGQFPSGTYYCKLDAVREVGPSPKFPDSGPRLVFDFLVADGPHAGKRTAQFCGKKLWSNPKLNKESALLKFARQLGCPDPMKGFDPDQYLGKPYQVTVELTGTGPDARAWVRFVTPAVAGSSANLGQPPASSGPPPRRGTTNAGKPAPAFYWVETNPDADPIKVDDLRRFFTNGPGIDAAKTVLVCPDGGDEWKAAADYDSGLLF